MNRSQTKIRKIQEANRLLENRFLLKEQLGGDEETTEPNKTVPTSSKTTTTPTTTNTTQTGPASATKKHIGLLSLIKYKDNIKNIIDTLNSSIDVTNSQFKQEFCGDNGQKIQEKLKPVFQLIDDLIIQLKVDAEKNGKRQYTEGDIIKMLYNTFNGNIVTLMSNIASHLPEKPNLVTEVVVGLQNYLRNKYGQDGSLLSSVLSGILGKIGVTYSKLC